MTCSQWEVERTLEEMLQQELLHYYKREKVTSTSNFRVNLHIWVLQHIILLITFYLQPIINQLSIIIIAIKIVIRLPQQERWQQQVHNLVSIKTIDSIIWLLITLNHNIWQLEGLMIIHLLLNNKIRTACREALSLVEVAPRLIIILPKSFLHVKTNSRMEWALSKVVGY